MKKVYALIGYAVAALVLAVSIDVAARVGSSPPAADEKKAETIARDVVEKLDEVAVPRASAASCEKLFVLQKEMAVEMAVALSGKKITPFIANASSWVSGLPSSRSTIAAAA